MSKLTNLLIPLVLISTGAISCTNYSFVKKNDLINQQFVNTINQNGNYRQVIPQPEKEDMTSQAVSANIPTKKKPSSTANTKINNKTVDKEHVDNLQGEEQDKIELNQIGLAHLALGIAYAKKDLIDQAICEFQCAIEDNPHHLESHIQLGTAYRIQGMTNEAEAEFMKAMNIDLNEAVAKILFNALPVAENTKEQKDLFEAHINLGNEYKKEAKLKKAQLTFEKALALKPEHPVVTKSLSEIYFSLGASHMESHEYDNAIAEFNKVLAINPDFPQIKDVLEKAHYNLGIIYAENRKLDKAITEFNKTMEISHNYVMLDDGNFNIIKNGKKAISDKRIQSERSHSSENVQGNTNHDIRSESSHEEKKEPLQNQILHPIDVVEEMTLAEKSDVEDIEYDHECVEHQYPAILSQRNDISKLAQLDKMPSDTRQLQGTNSLKPENILLKNEPSKDIQDEEQIQENIAYEHTVVKKETDANWSNDQSNLGIAIQANFSGEKVVAKDETSSNYSVYTYNITRNYKSEIGVNEAIKKYEDATIKNPYDNNAFLNLAHAYYRKAMYLDDAIARREGTPEGNQNFSVKRFYLKDNTDNEKNSEIGLAEQTNTFGNNIVFRNRSGNMYEEMFHEAIIEYKNTLRSNPNASNSLYGLAFSFSVKGSSLGVASKSKNNPKNILFRY